MAKGKSKTDAESSSPALPLPSTELWTTPMAWVAAKAAGAKDGSLKPHAEYAGEYPVNTVYLRGEIALTLQTPTGPGMWSTSFPHIPALIRLEGGKPVEVHAPGTDGRCWTYRAEKDGRKTRWTLYVGNAYPATEPAATAWKEPYFIEYAMIHSLLPAHGSGKYISLMISQDGSVENLARAKDPDPGD